MEKCNEVGSTDPNHFYRVSELISLKC